MIGQHLGQRLKQRTNCKRDRFWSVFSLLEHSSTLKSWPNVTVPKGTTLICDMQRRNWPLEAWMPWTPKKARARPKRAPFCARHLTLQRTAILGLLSPSPRISCVSGLRVTSWETKPRVARSLQRTPCLQPRRQARKLRTKSLSAKKRSQRRRPRPPRLTTRRTLPKKRAYPSRTLL